MEEDFVRADDRVDDALDRRSTGAHVGAWQHARADHGAAARARKLVAARERGRVSSCFMVGPCARRSGACRRSYTFYKLPKLALRAHAQPAQYRTRGRSLHRCDEGFAKTVRIADRTRGCTAWRRGKH